MGRSKGIFCQIVFATLVSILFFCFLKALAILPTKPTTQQFHSPEPEPLIVDPVQTRWQTALDHIWERESSRGRADTGKPGPAGEMGEYQVTPVFVCDVKRITGRGFDPFDNSQCREAIAAWLDHYASRLKDFSDSEVYLLYNRGPGWYDNHRKGD